MTQPKKQDDLSRVDGFGMSTQGDLPRQATGPSAETLPEEGGDYNGPLCGYALYGDPCICTCGTCDVVAE